MSKNIIKLNEDYGIHCDEYNIILCERKINDKEDGDIRGNRKTRLEHVQYDSRNEFTHLAISGGFNLA